MRAKRTHTQGLDQLGPTRGEARGSILEWTQMMSRNSLASRAARSTLSRRMKITLTMPKISDRLRKAIDDAAGED